MAITVGTNTYATYAEYLAWAALRGYVVTATEAQVEAALVLASLDYIDANFNFKGDLVDDEQAMKLPTDDVTIAQIKPATLEACKMQLAGLLLVDPSLTSVTGIIESEEKSLEGVGSKSIKYKNGSAQAYKRSVPLVDALLRPYLLTSSQSVYRL